MRILRLRIDRFGPLRDLDTGSEPLGGLNVVTGPNEAGKSSFFLALRALLHGVYPASREGNPWTPWDGSDLEIRGEIRTRAGEHYRVHRRLLSQPRGRVVRITAEGEHAEEIGNHAVPGAAHVPRALFEHVHTITLPELARLQKGSAWKEVRDRLVLGMGTRDLGSPRRVANALEKQAGALWRSHRKGTPRDAELGARISELSERLREARDRDIELREVVRRRDEVAEALAEIRERLDTLRSVQRRAGELLPLERRLATADELRRRVGDEAVLEPLPLDPIERLEALEAEADELDQTLASHTEAVREAESALPPPDPFADALEARRDRARALVSARPVAEDRAGRLAQLRREVDERTEQMSAACRRLFRTDADAEVPDREGLDRLPLGELRRRIRARHDAANRRSSAEDRLRETDPPESTTTPLPGWAGVASLVGALLLVAAPFVPGTGLGTLGGWSVAGLGAVVALAGVVRLIEWDRARREVARERERRERSRRSARERFEELAEAGEEARAAVLELVEGLGLRAVRLEEPDETLAGELEALRERLNEADRLRAEIERMERDDEALLRELDELRASDPDLAEAIPRELPRALELLESALARTDDRAEARRQAELRREQASIQRERVLEERERLGRELDELRELLAEAAPEPDDDAARARWAAERIGDLARARAIEHEVVEERGPVASVRREIEQLHREPTLQGRSPETLDRMVRELAERESELNAETTGLDRDRERLLEGETVDQVEEALLRCREERVRVREDRDRLWLLARVVRAAEREFRETHQPELIRKAERHLARITGGRYEGLLLGDESNPDVLFLRAAHLPGPLPVDEPVSTGTREQVFLALRLAILELLEQDGEPLPLVLDEALVNWDRERRGRALDLLEELSEERQIFLFTLHDELAREILARGGRGVELGDP